MFNPDSFVAELRLDKSNELKKVNLLQIGQYFKVTVNLSMGKGGIKKLVLNYLVENEIFPEKDLERMCYSV